MKKTKPPQTRQKTRYHVHNWREYERSLVARGSLTVWVTDEVKDQWSYHSQGQPRRGGQPIYSDVAIQTVLQLRELFKLPNRAVEGLMKSVLALLGWALSVPDHTTLSRRGKTLKIRLPKQATGALHMVMDSSGLKVYGEGEWKVRQHGWSKRRTWRKFHLAVDADSGEVQGIVLSEAGTSDAQARPDLLAQVHQPMASVTADGSYDKRGVYDAIRTHSPDAVIAIPPRRNAHIWQHGNAHAPPLPRDQNLRAIRRFGRKTWKEQIDYHKRSLAETGVFRFKTLFGDHLSARLIATQHTQCGVRAAALNGMTHLGMPISVKIVQ